MSKLRTSLRISGQYVGVVAHVRPAESAMVCSVAVFATPGAGSACPSKAFGTPCARKSDAEPALGAGARDDADSAAVAGGDEVLSDVVVAAPPEQEVMPMVIATAPIVSASLRPGRQSRGHVSMCVRASMSAL